MRKLMYLKLERGRKGATEWWSNSESMRESINRVKRSSTVYINTHVVRAGETNENAQAARERPTDGWIDGRTAEWMVGVRLHVKRYIENQNGFGAFTMFQLCGTCIKRKQELIKSQGKNVPAHTKLHFLQSGSNSTTNNKNNRKGTQTATAATKQKRRQQQQQKLLYCISIKFINRLQSFYIVTHWDSHTHTRTSCLLCICDGECFEHGNGNLNWVGDEVSYTNKLEYLYWNGT